MGKGLFVLKETKIHRLFCTLDDLLLFFCVRKYESYSAASIHVPRMSLIALFSAEFTI